jgi:GT2 family glycosyltransferase
VIYAGANLGYAGGNNLGLRAALAAGVDFVWVLNNDTVADPEALGRLVEAAAAHPDAGVLTTNVVETDGTFERSVAFDGTKTDAPWDFFGEFRLVSCDGCERGFHPVDGVRGPSLFMRAAALHQAGELDERYFHYYEELDLVERIRRQGWTSALVCRATVGHTKGTSLAYHTGQSIYYLFRNYLVFRKKLFGESLLGVARRHPVKLLRHALAPAHTLRGDLRPAMAYLLGMADAARNRTGIRRLGPRYHEQLRLER